MVTKPQRPEGRDSALSILNAAIDTLNLAKEISSITPAKALFGSVSILLTMIKDSMANDQDYVDLGLSCADICRALHRGMDGKRLDDLSRSVREAITQLATTVAGIQRKVTRQSQRNLVSRLLYASNDKDKIGAWRSELNRILHVFNTELAVNTNIAVSDIRNDLSKMRQEIGGQVRSVRKFDPERAHYLTLGSRTLGESPPPAPRAFFGRNGLVQKVVALAETLVPIALIGAGGIGKTSIALTVLHNDRIKERFGENRRFIRCDQFPASRANFLLRLSGVIGADVENPEDVAPLRPYLSSKEMLIVLDNAESILDPHGASGQEINAIVEELSQFDNICLCITSRITTVPPDCETLEIPTLPMGAARDTFYRIYKYGGQSDPVNNILEQLDFHPLSVTLLATVAHQNKWDNNRLTREWEQRQTGVLQTGYNKSLAHTIELSLASPMFRELGPDARGLLEVVAFFPQGVDENKFDWLFSTTPNRTTTFDAFCVLSLTYRNNGFITMLAPLRDYLRPQDPMSSPLLCATRDRYFTRMSIEFDRNKPVFRESRWVVSEDANVEHLLSTFASVDAKTNEVWKACHDFIKHIHWHKPRRTILRQTIESLPDDHRFKPRCLVALAQLFNSLGNHAEQKQLLNCALPLVRGRGDDDWVACVLRELCDANRMLGFYEEGIQQGREALEVHQRLGAAVDQADCLISLAFLLYEDKRLDAAKEAASHAIDLLPEKGQEFQVCQSHRILGNVYRSQGKRDKAIHHLGVALEIVSPFGWHVQLFWIHYCLAWLFLDEGEFGDANDHAERARSHAVDDAYSLGHAMGLRAQILYQQRRLEEAKSEALRALETYEEIGAAKDLEDCRALLRDIEQTIKSQATFNAFSDFNAHGLPPRSFAWFRSPPISKQQQPPDSLEQELRVTTMHSD